MLTEELVVQTGEVDQAVWIMREVAGWCAATDKNMWQLDELTPAALQNGITAQNFCVGWLSGEPAATMILQWTDPVFWPEINADQSGFIHKLCVRRQFAGKGLSRQMVEFAIGECRKRGIHYLRLDTGWQRLKLRNLYEKLGFVCKGRKVVAGKEYALYEMQID
ncbi:MAG TPA: GNAT family N-acetyltransferase [Bacillota bacterium]|nr:GNAT family N-acetyltransferase [Bacillota bacterium]